MNTIAQLPNEILLDIFERLRGETCNLVSASKTCRRWHRLASTTIYRHISLSSKLRDETRTARFAASVTQCDLVQSFDLRITQVHLMGFSILSSDAFDRLMELCDVVTSMQNMQTFTLSFEKAAGQGFTAPSATIVSLLQSLPQTVVNLNLDCECMSCPKLNQPHVCEAIGALLPRLRSLRLRTSHLCSGLLSHISPQATLDHERLEFPLGISRPTATSSLEYLSVCLVLRPESGLASHTNLCYSGHRPMQGARLSSTLLALHKAKAFPSLRQFAVIGRVDANPTPQNDNWNVFKVRSLTKHSMTTTTFPWCARGGSSSLYMLRDDKEDWFGSFDEITSALEGSLLWTKRGIRGSHVHLICSDSGWQLDTSRLASRSSVIDRFGVSFRLWKHEEAARMRLLHIRTAPGFDDTAASSQIVPDGWRWVPEGPWNWTIATA